jgi:hypothetical protein
MQLLYNIYLINVTIKNGNSIFVFSHFSISSFLFFYFGKYTKKEKNIQ